MAAETFLKIAKLTQKSFVIKQDKETRPYVWDLINSIKENC